MAPKPRKDHVFLRILDTVVPSAGRFWITWNKQIYYPNDVNNPLMHWSIIDHERVHIAQQSRFWGGWWLWLITYALLPFPVLFAYYRAKWEIEAYAINVIDGTYTEEEVVETLWSAYAWTYPKPWMRKMLTKELQRRGYATIK